MSTKRIFEIPTLFLSVSAEVEIGPVAGKKIKDCFTGPRYWSRSNRFDTWISIDQPDACACTISALTLPSGESWNYAKIMATILGIGGNPEKIAFLGKLLSQSIEGDNLLNKLFAECLYTITLTQVEEMVESTERNDFLLTNGHHDYFLVETGDEDDPLTLCRVNKRFSDEKKVPNFTRYWSANVISLYAEKILHSGDRLLIRNLDTSRL